MDEKSNASETQGTQAPESTDVKKYHDLIKEYGQSALIAVTIVVVAGLGWVVYKNYKQSSEVQAMQKLFSVRSPEELQQLSLQYGSTPAAAFALLTSASLAFDAAQYEMAQSTYTQFIQKYPAHPLTPAAELGLAQCLEALGQIDPAQQGYEKFVQAHPGHYLETMAIMGKARCLDQLGKFDQAKAIYEDYIAANPDGVWTPQAESGLLFLDMRARAAKKGGASKTDAPAPAVTLPLLEAAPVAVPPVVMEDPPVVVEAPAPESPNPSAEEPGR